MRVDEYRKRMKTLSITFLSFSPDGKELLVNLGGEQLYLFDVYKDPTKVVYKYDTFKETLKFPDETTTDIKKFLFYFISV